MFITYILFSETLQKFYIGYTSMDVNLRLTKHLANHKGFTSRAKDWLVVYTEEFTNKEAAHVCPRTLLAKTSQYWDTM